MLNLLIFIGFLFLCVQSQCVTCENKESCCSGTKCCGKGDMCCDGYSEACCPDPVNGSVCCLAETTFCCPRLQDTPSHCCPNWMVCCLYGRYGCCNPGAKQAPYYNSTQSESKLLNNNDNDKKLKSIKSNVYAMFEIAQFDGDLTMSGLTIGTSSGKSSNTATISGPYNNWGELSRVFSFDPKRKLFYLLQATFVPVGKYKSGTEPITFYSIDPVSGAGNSSAIKGATGLLTGYLFDSKKDIFLFATYKWNPAFTQKIGYNFYTLDVNSPKVALLKSTYLFPNNKEVNSLDDYTGWFRHQSANGVLYRLGYQDVYNSVGFGLAMTDISTSIAQTSFSSVFVEHKPSGYDTYISITPYKDCFLSLAPSTFSGELSIIMWNLNGTVSKVLADLGNSHTTPHFGPLLESIDLDQTTYAALVVYDGIAIDTWSLVVTDLTSPDFDTNIYTVYPPVQGMDAETDSPFGLGFAK